MGKIKVLFKMFYLYHKAAYDPLIELFEMDPKYDVSLSLTHEIERTFGLFDKDQTKKYLQILYDEVIEVLKKDIPVEDGLKTVAQSEKNNWVLFDRINPGNVVRTFMRYEWEN